MLRYKKHKKHADGVPGSGVGVMDDTDREVSSFTDRAFRSLCVAEEELFNDVPHIPSPIRGMPLSTKYHLGIFNLSVRKTQPLAQLPAITRQRGKWAPTFQPLLNSAKDGLIVAKTNTGKLCAPQPTGYKPSSKVSSLIRSFDNIENERPEQDRFPKGVLRAKMNIEETSICQKVEHNDVTIETIVSTNSDDVSLQENRHSHRRTAREVFLESQAEISSRMSASPCSSGSPLPDQVKKLANQNDALRRSAFLHSENSAFKSWSDINKRHHGGDDSDSSVPGTPPILSSGTPCSPLLQRTTPGVRARDGGLEVGWASPASTLSNSFDTIQMLRTVPPLPNKRMSKQNRESSHRAPKVPPENKIQAEDMQVDLGSQSPKEQPSILSKSKSPKKLKQALTTNQEKEAVPETQHPKVPTNKPKHNKESQEIIDSSKEVKKTETVEKEDVGKLSNKPTPPSGRIKTLIEQMEKESVKDAAPVRLPEKKHNVKDPIEMSMETLPSTVHAKPPEPNPQPISNGQVPPWRRIHAPKPEPENSLSNKSIKESASEQAKEDMVENGEDSFEDKPSLSSFNITNLLTPVIRRKSVQEALEEQPMAITPPPPADTIPLNDQDQSEISLYRKRNEYKSKATSLLFNLKDMRKRVKSTYNPSTGLRNGHENHQRSDSRLPEVLANGNSSIDTSKQVSETENVCNADQSYIPRLTMEEEAKRDILENSSDNYLCLSSPSQTLPSKVVDNAKMPTEDINTDECAYRDYMSPPPFSPIEHKLKKQVDYPILNLYPKEDKSGKVEQKEAEPTVPVWRQKVEKVPLEEQNIKHESKQEEPPETVPLPISYSLETALEKAKSHAKQPLLVPEIVNQSSTEGDEGEKQMVDNDSLKDDLQYYAVSNGNVESTPEEHEALKEEIEEKVEEKEPLVSDKQVEDRTTEEVKSPSSLIQFKPNLFHIKDNKTKSSPVTKSVRPLLRSLSEDCLNIHRGDDFSMGKGDFRVSTPSSWKNRDVKIDISRIREMSAQNREKHWNHVATPPVLESPDHKMKDLKPTHHEERGAQDLWEMPCCETPDWRNNEEDLELVELTKNIKKNAPPPDGPFFHPVETCVSDVTGLSPECNSLLVHHASDSIKDLVNGEDVRSPHLDNEDTNYSPLDNGLLQFEDAISFSEDIACSSITSPMSESITCSMVASPMSVNTQSSGFTTALSAIEDMPSPPLPFANPRSGKSNLSAHDVMSLASTPSGRSETKTTECIKQTPEKAPCIDSMDKAHAAKPPTVPPKTEKALRRAKRLTKKRRKTDIPPKISEGDYQECDLVLDVPSPANMMPSSMNPQSDFKAGSCTPRAFQQESFSEPSTPSFQNTQRKLLQDPDSGQYFVVDIPVHFRIKTFFDPETGKYLQMSLPPSERSTPTLEMANSPFMLYQGLAPVPAASIAALKRGSQILNHSGVYREKSGSLYEEDDDCLKMQSIDCGSCDQSMAGTPHSMDRNADRTRSPDIISMGDLDDFAMEAIS